MLGQFCVKVEQHRENRAAFFSSIDAQTEGDVRAEKKFGTSDPAQLAVAVLDYDAKQLLALLAEGEIGHRLFEMFLLPPTLIGVTCGVIIPNSCIFRSLKLHDYMMAW